MDVTSEQGNSEADTTPAPVNRMRRRLLAGLTATGAAITFPGIARAPVGTRAASFLPAGYVPAIPATVSPAELQEWAGFRARFVMPDGRVVDTANGGTSHSEGQGYGLLLAEWVGDLATFERILDWTLATLPRQGDSLFAWQYRPDRAMPVEDRNSATDGDMAIAWALQRAADRWGRPDWHAMAIRIARDILRLAVCQVAGRTVLLPGPAGFQHARHVVINPSYYNFPAMRSLARLLPDPAWLRLEADGMWLLQAARFGRWGLPPDWIEIDRQTGAITPDSERPPRFSWDAVRVPLFLAWAGESDAPALAAAVNFWNHAWPGRLPAWVDLRSGALAPYPGHAGIAAVAALGRAARSRAPHRAEIPHQASAEDYYGAALVMLARLARSEAVAQAIARRLAEAELDA